MLLCGQGMEKLDEFQHGFGEYLRNVMLGLVTDGLDPFSDKNRPYSMWPVVLIPHNVSFEFFLKDTTHLLSMLIPGPKAPTKDIDVRILAAIN